MKRQFIIIILIALGFTVNAQGVKFREDLSWAQLKETANAEHKYIFLDVMATWCGPCKAMEREVYPDTNLGAFLDKQFISVKVQTDQTKNDNAFVKSWYSASKEIMNMYQVTGLPSLLFLSPDGKLLYKSVGYRSKQDLKNDASRALNPQGRYDMLLDSYFQGHKGNEFINELVKKTDSIGRHIMAQKILFDSFGTFKDSTAFAVLSKLKKRNGSLLKSNFMGNWKIDYQSSIFGEQPLRAAAKSIEVIQVTKAFKINRLSSQMNGPDIITNETILPGEKISLSSTAVENRKKLSRQFVTTDGRSFTEFSEVTNGNGDNSIDYVIVEDWSLQTDGSLKIIKTVFMNDSQYSLTLIYRK